MGFEPAQARRDYIYNPDRNPNLQLDMPTEVPPDRETCVMWDKEADSHNGKLESEYYTALQAHLEVLNTTIATVVPPGSNDSEAQEVHAQPPRSAACSKRGTAARKLLSPKRGKARRFGRL